jgi:hypothetical protein
LIRQGSAPEEPQKDGLKGLSREGSIPANQGKWMAIRKAQIP